MSKIESLLIFQKITIQVTLNSKALMESGQLHYSDCTGTATARVSGDNFTDDYFMF